MAHTVQMAKSKEYKKTTHCNVSFVILIHCFIILIVSPIGTRFLILVNQGLDVFCRTDHKPITNYNLDDLVGRSGTSRRFVMTDLGSLQ